MTSRRTSTRRQRRLTLQNDNKTDEGPWWRSSGQRARLQLRRSEFDYRYWLQFSVKFVLEKNENKQKEAWVSTPTEWKTRRTSFLIPPLILGAYVINKFWRN